MSFPSLPSSSAGLTLLEMVVVVAIITIVSAIVLANLPAFREKTSLDLVAEEVAITIRQAQAFGVATRAFITGSTGEFPSHGVFFDLADLPLADPDSFILFADRPPSGQVLGNGQYDAGNGCGSADTECREEFIFRGGVYISDISVCGGSSCQSFRASDPSDPTFNIVFQRPESDARFYPDNNYSYVKIAVQSLRQPTEMRYVVVWNTGHIYACNPASQPAGQPTIC